MGDVEATAGDLDKPQVALDHDHLGGRRDRGQAEPRRDLAFGHRAAGGEARLLRVLHHQQVEGARVGQRAAHHHRIGDGIAGVGEGERAGGGEQAELGELAALQPLGRGGIGADAGEADIARAPGDELDQRHVVDHRLGVGQRHHGGDAAGHRRGRAGLHRFLVLGAGLAQLDPHVDEARREAGAGAIDDLGERRRCRGLPSAAMRPSSTRRSPGWSRPLAGSSRRALRKRMRALMSLPAPRWRGCASAPRGRPCARRRPSRPAGG